LFFGFALELSSTAEQNDNKSIVMKRRNSLVTGCEVKVAVGLLEFVGARHLENAEKLSEKYNVRLHNITFTVKTLGFIFKMLCSNLCILLLSRCSAL
jgi:hypothetical protein